MAVLAVAEVAVVAVAEGVKPHQKGRVFSTRIIMLKIAKQVSLLTDSVIVGFSCGKDSIATLDICAKFFKNIAAYFMFLVPGLTFQERYLEYIESKYRIQILRLPHWQLGSMIRSGTFRPQSWKALNCAEVSILDMETELRARTGFKWVASGMKRFDSIERNAMLRKCRGIDGNSHRFFPVMEFTNKAIYSYIREAGIHLPRDYEMFGRSFGRLWPRELLAIRQRYPEDFEKIKATFPFVEAVLKKHELAQ